MRKYRYILLLLGALVGGHDWISSHSCSAASENAAFAGTYEYVYAHNTKEVIENHYIILEQDNETITGRYYGTSDDFDPAREGYLPGFYVAEMEELAIKDAIICFSINLRDDEIFVKPLSHTVVSAKDVDIRENPRWINDYQPGLKLEKHSIAFQGTVVNDEIHITTESGTRIFKKIQ